MAGAITKKSKINKLGVFAVKDFKPGEVVLKWKIKKILTKEEAEALPPAAKRYVSNYRADEYVLQNPPERYVNHSCDPNTEVIDNCDVATRNIKEGEEITSDYSRDKAVTHSRFSCNCGSKNCRKFI